MPEHSHHHDSNEHTRQQTAGRNTGEQLGARATTTRARRAALRSHLYFATGTGRDRTDRRQSLGGSAAVGAQRLTELTGGLKAPIRMLLERLGEHVVEPLVELAIGHALTERD